MKFNPEKSKVIKMTSAKDDIENDKDAQIKAPEPMNIPPMHQSEKLNPGAMLDALNFYRVSGGERVDEDTKRHDEESEKP